MLLTDQDGKIEKMAAKHKIRADGHGKTIVMTLTARQAIIQFCKECVWFNSAEVRRCAATGDIKPLDLENYQEK